MNQPVTPPRALVLVIRGLSPAHLGCYGNEWLSTRTIDRLAARGIVFDQHYADVDPTPDWPAVFVARIALPRPDENVGDLAAVRLAMYEAMESAPKDRPALIVVEIDAILPPWEPPGDLLRYYFGDYSDDPEADPPLSPWVGQVPESVAGDDDETVERLQNSFAAQLTAVDIALTKLLAGARKRGFGVNALTVVTSDRSLPLGEIPGPSVEGQFHLPLVVRLPSNIASGDRIAALTVPGDVNELLHAHLLGGPSGLHDLIHGRQTTLRDRVIVPGGHVRTPDLLLVAGETPRLYVKPHDRWEVNDVAIKREWDVEQLLPPSLPRD